ncbi:MAG: lamin tail domain-containing protein [Chitinophagales bacterium]|nr:lamin tail domain-containing protein [Chitinophagales bacterium]
MTNTTASNLFISEYSEPNGGNCKYIELYNGTGVAIDLANYEIWGISNGGTWTEYTLNYQEY